MNTMLSTRKRWGLSCLILVFRTTLLFSQTNYYAINRSYMAGNPGTYADREPDNLFPEGGNWKELIYSGDASLEKYSDVQTLPFPFKLNNTLMPASYKVSSTGIITFDPTASGTPPIAIDYFPDNSMPNNSVFYMGGSGKACPQIGNNYASVRSRIYGESPNRQLWVNFFGCTNPNNNLQAYIYSIVLEEGSNKIFFVDQMKLDYSTTGDTYVFNAGVQISSSLAFSPNPCQNIQIVSSSGRPDDNRYVELVPGVRPDTDIEFTSVAPASFAEVGNKVNITGEFRNTGKNKIDNLTLQYQDINNLYEQAFSNIALESGSSQNFSISYTIEDLGYVPVKMWFIADGDTLHTNDTLLTKVCGGHFTPEKRPFVEGVTNTSNMYGPICNVSLEKMNKIYPKKSTVVAVHVNWGSTDPMTLTAYNNPVVGAINSIPEFIIDRNKHLSYTQVFPQYTNTVKEFGFADLALTAKYDAATKKITANAKGLFSVSLKGDYRFALIVTEDSVKGKTSGYNQSNIYSGGAYGAMGGYENLPNPVPASQMTYNFVPREIVGGYLGQEGSLPEEIKDSATYSYTFTSSALTKVLNPDNLKAKLILIDAVNNVVLNSQEVALKSSTAVQPVAMSISGISIYPNPVQDQLKVSVQAEKQQRVKVTVLDVQGREVYRYPEEYTVDASATIELNTGMLPQGMYFLNLSTHEGVIAERFVKATY